MARLTKLSQAIDDAVADLLGRRRGRPRGERTDLPNTRAHTDLPKTRAHTLSGPLRRAEIRAAALVEYPGDVERPRTRGDCADGPRPCPWVSCRYHLYLDAAGPALKLNFPDREPDELRESCALDVADRGGVTLEESGRYVNVTRERLRQIETIALKKLQRRESDWEWLP